MVVYGITSVIVVSVGTHHAWFSLRECVVYLMHKQERMGDSIVGGHHTFIQRSPKWREQPSFKAGLPVLLPSNLTERVLRLSNSETQILHP